MSVRAPGATFFPYTTLFRSHGTRGDVGSSFQERRSDRRNAQGGHGGRGQDGHAYRGQACPSCPRPPCPPCAFLRSDRKSTRLNSSHANISYAVFCLKKKNKK